MGGRRVTSSTLGPGRPAWGRCAPAAGEWGPSLLPVPVFSRECDGSSFAERGRSGQARSLAESGKGRKRSLCREAERTGPRNVAASPAGPRPPWGWPQSQPGGSRCSPAALPPLDLGDRGGVKSPQATLEPSLVAHLAFRMAIAWGGGGGGRHTDWVLQSGARLEKGWTRCALRPWPWGGGRGSPSRLRRVSDATGQQVPGRICL